MYEPIVNGSTSFDVVVAETTPSTSSRAVAPASVYEPPTISVIGVPPVIVIAGEIISDDEAATTFTSLTAVALFNAASIAEYATVYVPIVNGSTLFEVVVAVTTPSTLSSAVAPASVYVPPTTIVVGVPPVIVITGAILS